MQRISQTDLWTEKKKHETQEKIHSIYLTRLRKRISFCYHIKSHLTNSVFEFITWSNWQRRDQKQKLMETRRDVFRTFLKNEKVFKMEMNWFNVNKNSKKIK